MVCNDVNVSGLEKLSIITENGTLLITFFGMKTSGVTVQGMQMALALSVCLGVSACLVCHSVITPGIQDVGPKDCLR